MSDTIKIQIIVNGFLGCLLFLKTSIATEIPELSQSTTEDQAILVQEMIPPQLEKQSIFKTPGLPASVLKARTPVIQISISSPTLKRKKNNKDNKENSPKRPPLKRSKPMATETRPLLKAATLQRTRNFNYKTDAWIGESPEDFLTRIFERQY